jgi:prepilin-type processing-associated H-X9-DG protein
MVKAKGKSMSMSAQCQNNQKQLITAAIMYADDNRDWWPPNMPGANPAWCVGFMDFNAGTSSNTNIAILKDPNQSVIAPFIPKPQILHCPADKSFVVGLGARVRSVSMNAAVGTSAGGICGQPGPCPVNGQWFSCSNIGNGCKTSGFRTYAKTSQMVAPVPGMLWIFADEDPYSINDAQLQVQCALSGPFATIIDYPGSYHAGAGSFSFADGHTELHKWTGQGIQAGSTGGGGGHSHPANDSSISDMPWLQSHSSAKN